MTDAILMIDFGTSGEKWTLLLKKPSGEFRVLPSVRQDADPENAGAYDRREWNPQRFIERMVSITLDATYKALELNSSIRGISATATTSSIAPMRGLELLSDPPAVRWEDRRAQGSAVILEELRRETNAAPWMTVAPDAAIARAHFLANRYAAILSQPDVCLVEQLSLVGLFWTGELTLAESIACRKWGFTRKNPWPELFRKGIGAHLTGTASSPPGWLMGQPVPARVCGAGEVIGQILPSLAVTYNLRRSTAVIAAPYDTISQMLGLGLLHLPRAATVSLGTSMGVCALLENPHSVAFGPYGPLPEMPAPGYNILFDGLSSCGSALEVISQIAGIRRDDPNDYSWVSDALAATKPGSGGVTILPYFGGGRRALNVGPPPPPVIVGFQPGRRDHLVRALLEAFGYHIRIMAESFQETAGTDIECLSIGGGMAKNAGFMQMLADITGRVVLVGDYADSGLLGCGICGAVGLGWFGTLAEASEAILCSATKTARFGPAVDVSQEYSELYRAYCGRFNLQTSSTEKTNNA